MSYLSCNYLLQPVTSPSIKYLGLGLAVLLSIPCQIHVCPFLNSPLPTSPPVPESCNVSLHEKVSVCLPFPFPPFHLASFLSPPTLIYGPAFFPPCFPHQFVFFPLPFSFMAMYAISQSHIIYPPQ